MYYTDDYLINIDNHTKHKNSRKYIMVTNNKNRYVSRVIYAQNLKEAKILAREYVARLMNPTVKLEAVEVYR